jgi:hypothetical protein
MTIFYNAGVVKTYGTTNSLESFSRKHNISSCKKPLEITYDNAGAVVVNVRLQGVGIHKLKIILSWKATVSSLPIAFKYLNTT